MQFDPNDYENLPPAFNQYEQPVHDQLQDDSPLALPEIDAPPELPNDQLQDIVEEFNRTYQTMNSIYSLTDLKSE